MSFCAEFYVMKKQLFCIFLLLLFISCVQRNGISLQNGDLLFVGNSAGNLSKAIDEVTQTDKKTNFSHIALVEKSGKEIWILHAAPKNGSERIPLKEFIKTQKEDGSFIEIYRIRKEFHPHFSSAIEKQKPCWEGLIISLTF